MRSVVAVENVSLDGVMQAPARADEDTRGGFDLGGWAGPLLGADPEAAAEPMRRQGGSGAGAGDRAMLFGRRTYHDLVGHWLATTEPNPFTEVLRRTPKYVVSRDPGATLPHPASTLLAGEATQTVRALKQDGDGDLVVLGSGALVRDLAAAGLVDRYLLSVLPVVLGRGTRLFGETPAALEVEWSTTSPTGIVTACYRVAEPSGGAGKITPGS